MIRKGSIVKVLLAGVLSFCAGCARMPGMPSERSDVPRPDKELDFHVLYKQNCSGCHGDNGRGGAAIPLNNPALLAVAGPDNLRNIISRGLSPTLMPAFAASAGGMLTEQQVNALVRGMNSEWAHGAEFSSVALPPFSATTPGNAADGQKAYTAACARCHGADGTGIKTTSPTASDQPVATPHSIVDPSYLALVDDVSLRSYVIAGHLDANAPDWRSYVSGHPLTSQEITDIVAWIATHRAPVAEQSLNTPRTTPGVAKEKP